MTKGDTFYYSINGAKKLGVFQFLVNRGNYNMVYFLNDRGVMDFIDQKEVLSPEDK